MHTIFTERVREKWPIKVRSKQPKPSTRNVMPYTGILGEAFYLIINLIKNY
jgi:hypothetical protein